MRRRSRQLSGAVVLMIGMGLLLLTGCGSPNSAPTAGPILTGGVGTLDSLMTANRGSWVLVNVWATWCRPCVAETPDLVAFAQSMAERPFTMVGLSTDFFTVDESTALRKVTAFRDQQNIPYANLVYTGTLDNLMERLDLPGAIPTTILFSPDGKVAEQIVGKLSEDDFKSIRKSVGT